MADISAGTVEALFRLRDEMTPGLKNLQKNLEAMEKQFGKGLGDRMFDSAIAGAEKLTKTLNINVGGALAGGAAAAITAVGVAAVGAAASMISYSSNIVDLADKHRMTTDAVQKFGFAARQSGTDINSLLAASSKLSKNLGDGSKETAQSIAALGLSFDQLRNSSPEQQLSSVLKAVSAIKNPAEQAAIGAQLLGKGFREVLLVGPDLEQLTRRAEELGLVLSEKDLRAAEELGDSIDALGEMFMALVNNVGAAITSSESLHVFIDGLTSIFAVLSQQVGQNRQGMADFVSSGVELVARGLIFLVDVVQTAVDVWDGLRLTWQSLIGTAAGVASAVFGIAKAYADLTGDNVGSAVFQQQIDDFENMRAAAIEEADAVIQANADKSNAIQMLRGELVKLEANVASVHGKQHELSKSTKDTGGALGEMGISAEQAKKQVEALSKGMETFFASLSKRADARSGLAGLLGPSAQDATIEMGRLAAATEQLGGVTELSDAQLIKLVDSMRDLASQGGDNAFGFEALQAAMDEAAQRGDHVASAVGFALKKITTEAKKTATSFKDVFQDALQGLPNVILGALQGGGDVGKSIGAHLGGSIAKGLGDTVTKGLSGLLGKGLGSALGSILPGVGTLLGGFVGDKLFGAIGGLFGGGEERKVNDMRDQFVAAAGGLDQLGAKAQTVGLDLKAMLDADTVKEYEAAVGQLTGAWDTQAASQAAVNEAIERYGFTIDELGPRYAQQELDAKAAQLLQDYNLLNAAGVDQVAVITRMGPAMNEYVQQSMAAGVAIPEAMRPALEKMLEMGMLTDSAGNKLDSLDGVTFTQSLSEGLAKAIDGINRLVAALQGIPPVVNTRVVTTREEHSSTVDQNGVDRRPDIAAAVGFHGFVNGPTHILAGEAGRERVDISPGGNSSGGDAAAAEIRGLRGDVRMLLDLLPNAVRDAAAGRA